jgi:hypothetical protein
MYAKAASYYFPQAFGSLSIQQIVITGTCHTFAISI